MTRHFNTSRSLKAVNDSSTIDFAYLPEFERDSNDRAGQIRVPLLPDNYYPARNTAALKDAVEPVMRPEISIVSDRATPVASAMSEVVDNHAVDLDPYDLTSKVHAAASKITGIPVEKVNEPGMIRQLWNGFLDDLLGEKTKVGKA